MTATSWNVVQDLNFELLVVGNIIESVEILLDPFNVSQNAIIYTTMFLIDSDKIFGYIGILDLKTG